MLLILAGISIALLTGENGILTKASDSKRQSEEAQIIEEIKLAWNAVQINGIKDNMVIGDKATALVTELEKNNPPETPTATVDGNNINVTYKGYQATINTLTGVVGLEGSGNGGTTPEQGNTEINWEQIMETATKHPDQTSTNDIGIDANGNVCNLDYWIYDKSEHRKQRSNAW